MSPPLWVRSLNKVSGLDSDNPAEYNYFQTTYTKVSSSEAPYKLTVHITSPEGQASYFNASGIVISKYLVLTADHVFKNNGVPETGVAIAEWGKIDGGLLDQSQTQITHGTIKGGQTVQTIAAYTPNNAALPDLAIARLNVGVGDGPDGYLGLAYIIPGKTLSNPARDALASAETAGHPGRLVAYSGSTTDLSQSDMYSIKVDLRNFKQNGTWRDDGKVGSAGHSAAGAYGLPTKERNI